jgi:fructosamine-3-kinase
VPERSWHTRPDGRREVVKRWSSAPEGFFEAEGRGLAWLAEAGHVAVPDVSSVSATSITMAAVATGRATAAGAAAFGQNLAQLHRSGASTFGAPWPGFIGPLPMDNTPEPDWVTFYGNQRVAPFLAQAEASGSITAEGAASVRAVLAQLQALSGPSAQEPPSRLHGDLWSGNVLFDPGGQAWLIDPAAHGGHRETDLAMLALFGIPHLDDILDAYETTWPLAAGWRDRMPLHQLHPLLVHAVLFGPSYGEQAARSARRLLS